MAGRSGRTVFGSCLKRSIGPTQCTHHHNRLETRLDFPQPERPQAGHGRILQQDITSSIPQPIKQASNVDLRRNGRRVCETTLRERFGIAPIMADGGEKGLVDL